MALAAVLFAARPWPGAGPAAPSTDVVWQTWSPETVAQLRGEGKTIYVDFTARWCATCQSNKALVFSSAKVLAALRAARRGAAPGRLDEQGSADHRGAGVVQPQRGADGSDLRPGRDAPVVLPELLTPDLVLDALTKATEKD